VPNLGVVPYKDQKSFVVADIPGLIEGASEGVGLGHQFLRHVERCRVLVHLLDLSAVVEGRDPKHDFEVLNRELARYSPALAEKPQLVVANKLDLPHAREALPGLQEWMGKRGIKLYELSGATGEGLQKVLDAVARVLWAKPGHLPADVFIPARQVKKQPAAKKAKKPAAKKAATRRRPARAAKKAASRKK